MSNLIQADFHSGRIGKGEQLDLPAIIKELKKAQEKLAQWPIDSLIDIFDEFGTVLTERNHPIHRAHPNSGIAYIAGWCRRTHLVSLLENAFQSRHVLDGFTENRTKSGRLYRALPRGLIVHWMAGNVPTLGFLSLIQGVLTKNANLIKNASDSGDLLGHLLGVLSGIKEGEPQNGRDLVKSIAVIRYDHTKKDLGRTISKEADVRIFWGSDESVAELRPLPTKLQSHDLVFSNKTSFIAIDNLSLTTMDSGAVARRIARDVSVFEQKACASPHTLFLETQDKSVLENFALTLREAFSRVLLSIPKVAPSGKEISAILNLRAQYDMFHQAWYSDGVEFTLLSDDLFQLGPPIGNRVLFIRSIDDLTRLASLITPQVQSVGILAEAKNLEKLTMLFSEKGVQRFTNIGGMTHFESPWDGYVLNHHLIRWVSRPG